MILYNQNKHLNQTIECEDIEILKAGKNLRFWNIYARFYLTIRSVGDRISKFLVGEDDFLLLVFVFHNFTFSC